MALKIACMACVLHREKYVYTLEKRRGGKEKKTLIGSQFASVSQH